MDSEPTTTSTATTESADAEQARDSTMETDGMDDSSPTTTNPSTEKIKGRDGKQKVEPQEKLKGRGGLLGGNFGDHLQPVDPGNNLTSSGSTTCQDDPLFILECTYLKPQCGSEEWSPTLSAFCQRTCATCKNTTDSGYSSGGGVREAVRGEEECVDMHLRCSSPTLRDLCKDGEHGQLFQQRCPKTCGKCKEPTGGKGTGKESCLDRSPECQTYFDRCTHSVGGRE